MQPPGPERQPSQASVPRRGLPLSPGARSLLRALNAHGALHLNTTPRFPNMSDLGASWTEVMELVSGKYCFVSRLVAGKTTYLSLRLYEACAALAPLELPRAESMAPEPTGPGGLSGPMGLRWLVPELYGLLAAAGPLATEELGPMLAAEARRVRQALTWLQERLYVTVFGPGRHLNPNWDTYMWCTRRQWEAACPFRLRPPAAGEARDRIASFLRPYLSERQVARAMSLLGAGPAGGWPQSDQ